MTNVVKSYPAYDIVEPKLHPLVDLPILKAGDQIALKERKHKTFSMGSVVDFALKYNECPITAYNNAVERGHKTHWINANAVTISASQGPRKEYTEVHYGMKILFEGIVFTIEKAPNDNLTLVQVDTYEDIMDRRVAESKAAEEA